MSILHELVSGYEIPKLYLVKQKFERDRIDDISSDFKNELALSHLSSKLKPGMKIAITVGSRGIRNMPLIIKTLVDFIKEFNVEPIIIPSMGSHGGATSEGQRQVLESMGITEEFCGAKIYSNMDSLHVGKTNFGVNVFMDQYAYHCDGIIAINRVKPHVGFRGPFESGVTKMIAIGLGKQKGAEACHASGFGNMARNIPEVAKVILDTGKIFAGIAIIENAYDETSEFHVLRDTELLEKEPALLEKAKNQMPKIYLEPLDILVLEEIGKNITGTGMDTNIIGRYHTPYISGGPTITKIVVNRLTEESHGNANGIGLADFTTKTFFDSISFEDTYPNSLTSTVQHTIKIPMVLDDEVMALQGAIKTCGRDQDKGIRMAYIENTLKMEQIYYSEALLSEVQKHPQLEVVSGPYEYKEIVGWQKLINTS